MDELLDGIRLMHPDTCTVTRDMRATKFGPMVPASGHRGIADDRILRVAGACGGLYVNRPMHDDVFVAEERE